MHISPQDDTSKDSLTNELSAEEFLDELSQLDLTREYLNLVDDDIDRSPMNQLVLDLVDRVTNPRDVRTLITVQMPMKIKIRLIGQLNDEEILKLIFQKSFRQSEIYGVMKDPLRAIPSLLLWDDITAFFHLSRCLQRSQLVYDSFDIRPLLDLNLPLCMEEGLLSLVQDERIIVDVLIKRVNADLLYSVLDKIRTKELIMNLLDHYFDPSVRMQIKNQLRNVEKGSNAKPICD